MGKFIVLTGLDGCGTSSIAQRLNQMDLGSTLFKSLPFPYTEGRELIDLHVREVSTVAHYLYYQSANLYLSELIREQKKRAVGNIYCVRYLLDTVVSQRAAGLDLPYSYLTEWGELEKPDHIFYLDVSESERQRRLINRGKGYLDEQLDQEGLRVRFIEEFSRLEQYFTRIDTTDRTMDDIANEIRKHMMDEENRNEKDRKILDF